MIRYSGCTARASAPMASLSPSERRVVVALLDTFLPPLEFFGASFFHAFVVHHTQVISAALLARTLSRACARSHCRQGGDAARAAAGPAGAKIKKQRSGR